MGSVTNGLKHEMENLGSQELDVLRRWERVTWRVRGESVSKDDRMSLGVVFKPVRGTYLGRRVDGRRAER